VAGDHATLLDLPQQVFSSVVSSVTIVRSSSGAAWT